jgi:hypothetical protein
MRMRIQGSGSWRSRARQEVLARDLRVKGKEYVDCLAAFQKVDEALDGHMSVAEAGMPLMHCGFTQTASTVFQRGGHTVGSAHGIKCLGSLQYPDYRVSRGELARHRLRCGTR